jgi:hypothetical protein
MNNPKTQSAVCVERGKGIRWADWRYTKPPISFAGLNAVNPAPRSEF